MFIPKKKQNFLQHFSQIVKVLTEDDMGYPDTGDALACLAQSGLGVQSLRREVPEGFDGADTMFLRK